MALMRGALVKEVFPDVIGHRLGIDSIDCGPLCGSLVTLHLELLKKGMALGQLLSATEVLDMNLFEIRKENQSATNVNELLIHEAL
jgi:hypothetical protein